MSSSDRESISEIIHESGDASEQRLRSFKNMQTALAYEPELRRKGRSYNALHDEANRNLSALMDQKAALSVGSSRRKKTKLKGLEPKIRHQQKVFERTLSDVNETHGQLDLLRQARMEFSLPDVTQAIQDWVHDAGVQSVNVRTLSGWRSHGQPWLQCNRTAGREPQRGEILDVNQGWTDFVNQGWMQGGYDRGAAFRLLTPVSIDVTRMQKAALKTGDWKKFEADMTRHAKTTNDQTLWHAGNGRRAFYGQELVDLTRNQYAIHTDQAGGQVAMPKAKSALLTELRAKVRKVE